MVNGVMIMMHIIAYLAIIIVNALQLVFFSRSLRAYETVNICELVVYSICTMIFGLIVN